MKKIAFVLLLITGFASAQCFETINPGHYHTLGVKDDGVLFAWGLDNFGSLGNLNAPTPTNYPLPVHLGLSEWKVGVAGYFVSLGIKLDGSLYGWGLNGAGVLLPPSGVPSEHFNIPQFIDQGPWKSVSTSSSFTTGIKEDGTLWAWGGGNPITYGGTPSYIPMQIGTDNKWITAIADATVLYALKTDGSLWRADWDNPQLTRIGTDTWQMITARFGLKSDGSIWNIHPMFDFAQVGTDNDWAFVSYRWHSSHYFAIKSDGTLWTWGLNEDGQLGLGYISDTPVNDPVQVGTDTDWVWAAPGSWTSFAKKTDGSSWAWGHNISGFLGLGDYIPRTSPSLLLPCNALSTEDIALKNEVKIFPNPAEELINITFPNELTLDWISIYDIRGNLILEKNTNLKEINVSQFSTGVYLIRLHSGNNIVHKKFIKQ